MSTTTPINSFQLPSLGDTADIEAAVRPLGLAVDSLVVSRFSTTSGRDAAITSPSFGQMAAVSGTGELYYHNGNAWVSSVPRFITKTSAQTITSQTTLQNDNALNWAAEVNSKYRAKYILFMNSTTNLADMKINFSLPAGATRKTSCSAIGDGATTNLDAVFMETSATADLIAGVVNGSVYVVIDGIFNISSSSGTVTLQWAQFTSNATGITMQVDSYVEIMKIG